MESKKINKKFNSIFWSVIYTLPLIVLFLTFIGYLLVYKETGSITFDSILFDSALVHVTNTFNGFTWDIVVDTLSGVFELIGFNVTGNIASFVIILFTWFVQFAFIHIIIDFLVFIPRLFHNFLERWS